jgi:methionine-rich copper-binding protein CopC
MLAAWPLPAVAHTDLAGSEPAAGEVVDRSLDQVTLDFASPVMLDLTDVVVTTGGAPPVVGKPALAGSTVTVPVTVAAAGEYVVAYRTVAADGHAISGSFSFEVRRSAILRAPAERTENGGVDGATGGATGRVVAVVGVAILLSATVMRHRRSWVGRE